MAQVLITGSSSGIGFATALAFGRAGHKVAATMRSPNGAPDLANIAARENLAINVFSMDVDSDASVSEGIDRVAKEAGAIDVLVNTAGIERTGSVEEIPVTSVAGRFANSPFAPYTASKFALEALSESLAQEVKPFNIRVAIVEPGIIDTRMSRHVGVAQDLSPYPQQRRTAALFAAALKNPTPPSVVAEKVLEIAVSNTWQLRHLVGPDAAPFVGWRQSMSDEQWVDLGALDDNAWYDRVKADFGIDARAG